MGDLQIVEYSTKVFTPPERPEDGLDFYRWKVVGFNLTEYSLGDKKYTILWEWDIA